VADNEDDWLRGLLDQVTQMQGKFTKDMARQLEHTFRQQYAGDRLYVSRSATKSLKRKDQVIKTYLEEGTQAAMNRFGISRATVYRIVKK